LFSLFLRAVGQIVMCERIGVTPVIYFNRHCLYWTEGGYNGARNVWEYYFEPVSELRATDLVSATQDELEGASVSDFRSREIDPTSVPDSPGWIDTPPGVLASNVWPRRVTPTLFRATRRRRRLLADVVARRIRVRSEITAKADAFFAEHLAGRPFVGVHIRGREKAAERIFTGLPGVLPIEVYTHAIDAHLVREPHALIMCATDSDESLQQLADRYGSRVVAYPSHRLRSDQESVGLHHRATPEVDPAMLGEEVVIEWLLLSRSDRLVHGQSNVSLAVTLLAPAMPSFDVYARNSSAIRRLRREVWFTLRRRAAPARRAVRRALAARSSP
jgi:hypothetical protein